MTTWCILRCLAPGAEDQAEWACTRAQNTCAAVTPDGVNRAALHAIDAWTPRTIGLVAIIGLWGYLALLATIRVVIEIAIEWARGCTWVFVGFPLCAAWNAVRALWTLGTSACGDLWNLLKFPGWVARACVALIRTVVCAMARVVRWVATTVGRGLVGGFRRARRWWVWWRWHGALTAWHKRHAVVLARQKLLTAADLLECDSIEEELEVDLGIHDEKERASLLEILRCFGCPDATRPAHHPWTPTARRDAYHLVARATGSPSRQTNLPSSPPVHGVSMSSPPRQHADRPRLNGTAVPVESARAGDRGASATVHAIAVLPGLTEPASPRKRVAKRRSEPLEGCAPKRRKERDGGTLKRKQKRS